jgi:hypothetical protein
MRLETAFQVYSFTKLAAQWNVLRRPVIKYIIDIGGSIAIGECITFEEVRCCPVPPHYIKAYIGQLQALLVQYCDHFRRCVGITVLAEIPSTPSENSVTVPHLALRTANAHNAEPRVEHSTSPHTAGQARHE